MDKKKRDQFRHVLFEKRMELETAIKKFAEPRDDHDKEGARDTADLADSNYRMDFDIKRREMVIRQIKEIDGALKRIESGEFGVCETCGEDIPEGRLDARPNAKYCVLCKDEVEKKGTMT